MNSAPYKRNMKENTQPLVHDLGLKHTLHEKQLQQVNDLKSMSKSNVWMEKKKQTEDF